MTYRKEYARKWLAELRIKIMLRYSPTLTCARCAFGDIRALQFDHINGDGRAQRKALGSHNQWVFYRWIIRNNYPNTLQILCANCNAIKRVERQEWGLPHVYK